MNRFRTYTAYSIGCALAWGIIISVVFATGASTDRKHTVLLLLGGWAIGWTSATIARAVYPPPKLRRERSSVPVV